MLKSQLLRFNTSPLQRVRTVGNTGCASDRAHARTEIHFHLARTARSGAEQNERTNGGDCRPGSTCQLLHNPRLDLSRILRRAVFSRNERSPRCPPGTHRETRDPPRVRVSMKIIIHQTIYRSSSKPGWVLILVVLKSRKYYILFLLLLLAITIFSVQSMKSKQK